MRSPEALAKPVRRRRRGPLTVMVRRFRERNRDAGMQGQDVKTRGKTIPDATGGHAGVEMRMAVAYTEGVKEAGPGPDALRGHHLPECRQDPGPLPAEGWDRRRPRRGPGRAGHQRRSQDHGLGPARGGLHTVGGLPGGGLAVLRGTVMVEDKKLLAGPGGSLLKQRVSSDVLNRPAC